MKNVTRLSLDRNKLIKNANWSIVTGLNSLEKALAKQGTFDFAIGRKVINKTSITFLRATLTKMWPMGTHYWVRDNALIGSRLMLLEMSSYKSTSHYRKLGKDLLLSALNIMSTSSQITRIRKIITSNSSAFINCSDNYPQIFLAIKDNLSGNKHEAWAHKQDAWQITAYQVLTYLEQGILNVSDLNSANKEFLSLIVPFLTKIEFYKQSNSGSWEELEAIRTSVIAWEVALLKQIQVMSLNKKYSFLLTGYSKYKNYLASSAKNRDIQDLLASLLLKGALKLKQNIPFESPSYSRKNPKYREADSALIYLLLLGTPSHVADILGLSEQWITKIEQKLLDCISSLYDPRTGGHKRYSNDSYQRLGFFRAETVRRLTEMYGGPSGSADKNFVGRDKIVPKGPEASWTHFTWQLSAWAGARFIKTLDRKYFMLQEKYFKEGLKTITVPGDFSFEQFGKDKVRRIKIAAYRCPECYLTEENHDGSQYLFPSPHTPLNWAIAEAMTAFSAMRKSLNLVA